MSGNELTKVETVVEGNDTLKTITLSRPIEFEGEKYKEVKLDFEKLTGAHIEKAEMQFNAENPQNGITMVKEMSKGFTAIVASMAAGVPVGLIRALPASDYSKITMQTSLFLMAGE